MAPRTRFLPLLFLLSLCFAGTLRSERHALNLTPNKEEDCVYTVYVRTGSIIKGGTDSIIGLKLYDAYGYYIYITNLEAWGGLMDPGHDYFERGNLDIFSGRAPCLEGPVCAINVTSDGSGPHHGWYVNYVEVTSTGVHIPCAQQKFTVEQWLSTDASPYRLWALINSCNNNLGQARPIPKASDAARLGSGSGFSILGSTVRA